MLLLCCYASHRAVPAVADTLPIVSYSMENGNAGGQTYYDDAYGGPGATGNPAVAGSFLSGGLGQLTNGQFASAADIFDDQWIGWFDIQPTITFDLGAAQPINSVSLHASNNSMFGDVGAPGGANLSYSVDNVNFTPLGNYATTITDRSGDEPRWIDFPFGVEARYARLQLFDGVKAAGTAPGFKPWIFLDEARVNGGSAPPGFSYPNFTSTAGLKLSGNAARAGDVLRVTSATPHVEGNAFTANRVTLANGNSFNTHFRFRITDSAGISDEDGTGADGLVFVIDGGATGGGIGYGRASLAIEFDTYNNGPVYADPSGNHVGIDFNGSIVSVQTQTEAVRFNNGEVWDAWIDYDGIADQLEVRWSLTGVRPGAAQLSRTVDLATLLGNSVFAGFTSATAAAWGNHDVLSWEFSGASLAPVSIFAGDYDYNGYVDGGDLAQWRGDFGVNADSDADGDGDTDGADFLVWQRQLGAGGVTASGAAVPEPTSTALVAIVILGRLVAASRQSRAIP